MTTEMDSGLRTVKCTSCGRIVNIEPALLMTINKQVVNAGHANVDRGTIQCACGRQL